MRTWTALRTHSCTLSQVGLDVKLPGGVRGSMAVALLLRASKPWVLVEKEGTSPSPVTHPL